MIPKSLLRILPFAASSTSSLSMSSECAATELASVKIVPNNKLFVSEPDPRWFGNEGNPTGDPAWTNKNWLKSRFHFSFAEYNNYLNQDFGGMLRVMNDDLVQPHRGFGTHPHANMEIVTYIVDGELTHQDTLGTKESLGRGSVQFMTAGTGIRHSEFNHGDKPLRFIQTWINPAKGGLSPNYGSYCGDDGKDDRKNKLQHLVSNVNDKESPAAPVQINQKVDAYASELDLGQTVVHELPVDRQAYLLCIEGSVKVNGQDLKKYDACEIMGEKDKATSIKIEATGTEETENGEVAHVLMFSMPHVAGSGRGDL